MDFMKTKRGKWTTIGVAVGIVAVLAVVLVILFSGQGNADKWTSEAYDYECNLPMTDESDEWMQIDGELTEEAWQDKTWLEYSSNGVTFRVTTEFTEKGLYIAGEAKDPYVYYNAKYDYTRSSSFLFYIVREDEEAVDVNDKALFRSCRQTMLRISTQDYASLSNVRANVATAVQGTLNTPQESVYHETEGWSFEAFLSWEALRLEDKYFAEDGIPNAMKMYVDYQCIDGENENKINYSLRPLNTQSYRYDCHWTFGRDGLIRDSSSLRLGDAMEGPAASDKLTYSTDESGELVVTSRVNRTQFTWAQGPKSENFSIEATFTTNKDFAGSGRYGMGFITYHLPTTGQYNVFAVNADELQKTNTLGFVSAGFVDSLQWLQNYSIDETVAKSYISPYGEGCVHLKMIKIGGYMYYFVDNAFYKMEYIDALSGEASVGLFFNYPGTASDYHYKDYSDNPEELRAELSEHAYFISVPGVTTYGSVTANTLAVPKGESVTLQIHPNGGFIVGDVQINGESVLDQIKNRSYTFTPTEDVNVTADFHKLDNDTEACKLSLSLTDEEGNSVNGVTYTLMDEEGKTGYTGKDNGRGKIIITVPRKCTVDAGGQTTAFDGKYILRIQKDGYMPEVFTLDLDNADAFEETYVLRKFMYGSVSVNGKAASDAKVSFLYDEGNGLYYHPRTTAAGYARAYHSDYIASEYALTATITSKAATGTINVPGISLTTGAGSTINLKVSGSANRLYIHCGSTEVAVSNFKHSHSTKGGTATFSVVRKGENIYIFDSEGNLGVVLNEEGIHTIGDHAFISQTNLAATNASIARFFGTPGADHAVGILNHYNDGSAATYYDIRWSGETEKIDAWMNKVSYAQMNTGADSKIASVQCAGAYDPTKGFVIGGTGYLYVKSADASQAVHGIVLNYQDGSTESVPFSGYDNVTGISTFAFRLRKSVSDVEYQFQDVYTVTGKITAAELGTSGASVTFVDQNTGSEYTAVCSGDGSYKINLFPSVYDVLAVQNTSIAVAKGVSVQKAEALDMTLEQNPYYIGSRTVNGKKISSSKVIDATVNIDAADGTVTVPANDVSMAALLGNQIYTGADSFTYTIKVSGDRIPVSDGTSGSATQIGFGLTDGTNWWVFYIKQSRGQGKNIGIGLITYGKGGNDYFYTTSASPNNISYNGAAGGTLKVDAVLTIEKTQDKLVLYAGEGAERVELLTATADGYQYADASAGISNRTAEATHMSNMASFFNPDTEIALCLASFMHNADVTYQISVE